MATLAELLEELKGLDRKAYDEIEDRILDLRAVCRHQGELALRINPLSLDSKTNQSIVQDELQRAIAARGWHGSIEFGNCSIARISRYVGPFADLQTIGEVESNSPAEALLSAYIACLEQLKQ